jgi:hypothetical protein
MCISLPYCDFFSHFSHISGGERCSTLEDEMNGAYKVLIRKTVRMRRVGKPVCKWDNIKMDGKGTKIWGRGLDSSV